MVFATTNLFKGIDCPQREGCRLTNCIYGHDFSTIQKHGLSSVEPIKALNNNEKRRESNETSEPASKRRRVTYDTLADKPPSKADQIRASLALSKSKPVADGLRTPTGGSKVLSSLNKSVSPPVNDPFRGTLTPTSRHSFLSDAPSPPPKPAKPESLNPRLIPNDPAGHTKRALYLKHIHAEMQRLNKRCCENAKDKRLCLDENAVIRYALDDEEKVAREQPTVYANIVKNRIVALKKMTPDDWSKFVEAKLPQTKAKAAVKSNKMLDTGLSPAEEIAILPKLVIDQKPLAAHGYIPVPPTAEEAAEAAAAVATSRNYEVCDRCATRFQVFPDRDAEGRLTSSGPCQFHPSRKVFPPSSKADRETGPKEAYFPCCSQSLGNIGCTTHPSHVFKTTSPARLAATLPFITTPENADPSSDRHGDVPKAVTFDCEMGYTTHGMELIRLTAIAWPKHLPLLDVLVRPLGAVIDLNSRYSGVFPEHYQTSITYDEWLKKEPHEAKSDESGITPLPIVDSPQRAREILCSFLTPETPLMGHALENDLNAVRLCHPTIIDTVILYPHPRKLPARFGLKALSQKHLGVFIQTGGSRGHDSLEDAMATGDLIRVCVGETWRRLRSQGWSLVKDQLISPPPVPSYIESMMLRDFGPMGLAGGNVMDGTEEGSENKGTQAEGEAETLGEPIAH